MNYENQYDVRFKIVGSGPSYTVKYYSGQSRWPKIYKKFSCPDEETRREMFYILNTSRLCTICTHTLIDDTRSTCHDCLARAAASVTEENIAECPVCYNKMFRFDGSRKQLACRHELCKPCMFRLVRPHRVGYLDPVRGPIATCTIMCPLCRGVGWYDYSLTILNIEAPATVPPNGTDPHAGP
jgi:hypothetical protein